MTSLWADERVYYPVDVVPYTPAHHFEKGKDDPSFRTKLKLAVELVRRAVQAQIPFRAVVADSFYGEDYGVKQGLRVLGVGYVLALKPSHTWWHPLRAIGSLQQAARAGRWKSRERPGKWVKVTRTFRDGSSQDWWALEVITGPYGPEKPERVVIATTDPLTLPDLTTCYLATNLPAPGAPRAQSSGLTVASLEEVVRLYGLRTWVEQSYKQVKHALGWSQYQVRSDTAIRRHWQLVCCAFSFAGITLVTPAPRQRKRHHRGQIQKLACQQAFLLMEQQRGKKSARKPESDHRCPGRWPCVWYAGGWSPGSCCGAIGAGGQNCPHLLRCSSCSSGLNVGIPSLSTVRIDPCQQTTGRIRMITEDDCKDNEGVEDGM